MDHCIAELLTKNSNQPLHRIKDLNESRHEVLPQTSVFLKV
jgi:hypothetical protein